MPTPAPVPAQPTRRTVLKGSLAATAAGALVTATGTGRAAAAGAVFQHGVASGDPTGTAVVIWTRVTPQPDALPGSGKGDPTLVRWQVATDPQFTDVAAQGSVTTRAEVGGALPDLGSYGDHTVHVDVTGLQPYRRYWYRFTALGETSPVGRTQTAPDDGTVHALRLGLVSCSNYTGGYFTPYRYLAQRTDLDAWLHVGDYIYEYGNTPASQGGNRYGPNKLVGVRDVQPATDPLTLSDYRVRHGWYRTDADLQALHAALPCIVVFDDHEVANNTWDTGAENDRSATVADFLARRAAAYQAYLEWLPVRLPDQSQAAQAHTGTRFWRSFSFGPLADLSALETRQDRTRQVEGPSTRGGGFVNATTPGLDDPSHHLPEPAELTWLKGRTTSTSAQWHLVANQVVFAPVRFPGSVFGGPAGSLFVNSDQWDGYQADRQALVDALSAAPAGAGDTVFLTGDIHSSWANEVPSTNPDQPPFNQASGTTPSVAVELVCPSVTSDGFAELAGSSDTPNPAVARQLTGAVQQLNPWVRYLDGVGHGFCVVDVTPERVQCDWFFVSDRTDPQATLARGASYRSLKGTHRLVAATDAVGPRSDSPAGPAPTADLPEGVTPAALALALGGAAALAWHRRRAAVQAETADGAAPLVG